MIYEIKKLFKNKRKWISLSVVFVLLFYSNYAIADSSSATQEDIEYCNSLNNNSTDSRLGDSVAESETTKGRVCSNDLIANMLSSIFGNNFDETDIAKDKGYEATNEAKQKAKGSEPFTETILSFYLWLTIATTTLGVFWYWIAILMKNAAGKGKEVDNWLTGTFFTLQSGFIMLALIEVVMSAAFVSLYFANWIFATFIDEIETSEYSKIVSNSEITEKGLHNSNELIAIAYSQDRTERFMSQNFNVMNEDVVDKSFTSFITRLLTKEDVLKRLVSELPATFAAEIDNEIFIEFFNLEFGVRAFIDSYSLIKNDVERIYNYDKEIYGRAGSYGSLVINNNTKEMKNLFLGTTNEADDRESEVQNIMEESLENLSKSLANDQQLSIFRNIIIKYVEAKIESSGAESVDLDAVPSSVIDYVKTQMNPSMTMAMSRADDIIKDASNNKIFAQMMAGQIAAQVMGGSYSGYQVKGEFGQKVKSVPRFIEIMEVFTDPIVENLNIHACSGEANYQDYVHPFKKDVEKYNSLPMDTDQIDISKFGIQSINMNCVNITEEGLELIGDGSKAAKRKAYKEAQVGRLALAIYFAVVQKAAIELAEEHMNKTDLLDKSLGFASLFINVQKIMGSDDVLNFGKEYLLNTASYQATIDYGSENYFVNTDIAFPRNGDITNHEQKLRTKMNPVNLSLMMRSGTKLQPAINADVDPKNTKTLDLLMKKDDVIEMLLLVDLTAVKQMACLDPNQSINQSLRDKADDPVKFDQQNFKCIDILTGSMMLGKEMMNIGINAKLFVASLAVANTVVDSAASSVASISKTGGKLAAGVKLLSKGVIGSLYTTLSAFDFYFNLLIIGGVVQQFLIPLMIPLALIQGFITFVFLIYKTFLVAAKEVVVSGVTGGFSRNEGGISFFKMFRETINNLIGILLFFSIYTIAVIILYTIINSIGATIAVQLMMNIMNSASSYGLITGIIVKLLAVISFPIITWFMMMALLDAFKEFIQFTFRLIGIQIQTDSSFDRGAEQMLAGNTVANAVDSIANAAKNMTPAMKKIQQMKENTVNNIKTGKTKYEQNSMNQANSNKLDSEDKKDVQNLDVKKSVEIIDLEEDKDK